MNRPIGVKRACTIDQTLKKLVNNFVVLTLFAYTARATYFFDLLTAAFSAAAQAVVEVS